MVQPTYAMLSSSLPSDFLRPAYSDDASYVRALRLSLLAVLGFLCLLYVPFAGNYGLWDPWETHYGEVARQMAARNDWISLWWPGSPQDPASGVFWSKPVLSFWLMALSLKLFGLGHSDPAQFHEMVVGWRAEWALRLPFILLGILGIWATYHLVLRLASRRAALWSAVVLGTSAQWALISRQAMTDMPFVVPMTVAVAFAGLALIPHRRRTDESSFEDAMEAPLPRRSLHKGPLRLSWPHAKAFYGFLTLYALCVIPQLLVNLVQLETFSVPLFGHTYRVAGAAAVLPFVLAFGLSLYYSTQARTRRSIYLWIAYLMGALATLAKGPAGIAMPILVVLIFLLITGRMDEIWGGRNREGGLLQDGLELVRGTLIFFCVGAPWYVAMVARHGAPFWMELIGDNYVHRAQGRHGDRGTFEYYLRQLGSGLFPWSGVVVAAVMQVGRWMRAGDLSTSRRQLVALCLSWFVVDFAIVTLVNTKFHHYILPALPALGVLAGLLMEEVCAEALPQSIAPENQSPKQSATAARTALLLLGVPLVFLCGRDLANFPARIGWLFNYDYVNVPGTGRPWPLTAMYGERYEYGTAIYGLVLFATLGTLLLALRPSAAQSASANFTAQNSPSPPSAPANRQWLYGLAFIVLLGIGIAAGPAMERVSAFSSSKLPTSTVLPADLRFAFLVPLAAAGIWLIFLLRRYASGRGTRLPIGAVAMALCGVVTTSFILDRFLIDLSPHWSQKHVFATYYRLRKDATEPVVAWMMYWRGETLYTCNQIYDHRLPADEKTVFLGERNAEKLQTYLQNHRGRRIFFLIERHRLESLRSLLPEAARKSLEVVDDSNNKVYLARAQL